MNQEQNFARVERRRKESDLVAQLSSGDPEKIKAGLETIRNHAKLSAIENVEFYCQILPHIVDSEGRRKAADVYHEGIEYLLEVLRNHGLSENGQFDSHAVRIIALLDSPKYKHLRDEPLVKESLQIVQDHYREDRHSKEYEKRLNYLHERITHLSGATPQEAVTSV